MGKLTSWHGIDASKTITLCEQKLLVRRVSAKGGEWEVIHTHPFISGNYGFSRVYEEDIKETYTDGWMKDYLPEFLGFVGLTLEEWEQLSFVSRIFDLIQYFGAIEFCGSSYSEGMTLKEVCKYTHIKYEEVYEEA